MSKVWVCYKARKRPAHDIQVRETYNKEDRIPMQGRRSHATLRKSGQKS